MLYVHRSHDTEALVERLASLLHDDPLRDPMQPEWLMVGSRGMERWVTARLAQLSPVGVAANLVVDLPSRFVQRLVDDVLGEPDDRVLDPWSPDVLEWTIAGALPDAVAADPATFAPVAGYLGIEPRESPEGIDDGTGQLALAVDVEAVARATAIDRRALGVSRQLAELFVAYGLHRPDMVRGWRQGRDLDADGRPLGELRWQAALWRVVAGQQDAVASPADRVAAAAARLSDGHPLSGDVPRRLVLFGMSSVQPGLLELLASVAGPGDRDVHVFVPSPSPRLWSLGRRGAEDRQPANALLRAAGRVGRDAPVVLREAVDGRCDVTDTALPTDLAATGETTLLRRLQAGLVHDTPLPRPPRHDPLPGDRSVVFHDGHGAVRQVEAVRDELLRRFDEDPTLQPRDVVVLTPDLATHAPLVRAVFADPEGRRVLDGRAHGQDPPTIPVAVADRSVGVGNPIAAVLRRVLHLVHARASGAEVLDLLGTEPVRARFRLTAAEMVTVQRWVEDTGVAWARDAEDRRWHRQPPRDEHTWAAAVDRLLVGVAVADSGTRTVGGVLPYDHVEGAGDLQLLDRLTRALDVVDGLVALRGRRSPTEWADALADRLDRLTGPPDGLPWLDDRARNEHRRHRARVDAVLSMLRRANEAAGRDVEARALARWVDRALDGGGGAAGHGTGAVTVAELVPLRAIPFRVVCLLGMDTGRFPRATTPPAFDLVARDPRPGDRDRRVEDRAAFVDAVHAAGDALVVAYAGRDPVSGHEQPPAIPVVELRDAVEAHVGSTGLADRTIVHAVLPTSPRSFSATDPSSFDVVRLRAARAAGDRPHRPPSFVRGTLPVDEDAAEVDELDVEQLRRVLARPAQALLDRLRVARPEDLRTFPETEPLALDALQRWQVGTALLDQLAGLDEAVSSTVDDADVDRLVRSMLARGRVPAGAVGRHEVRQVRSFVGEVAAVVDRLGPVRERVPVRAPVGAVELTGEVRMVTGDRRQAVETWYGRAEGRRYLRAWLRHLVASADRGPDAVRTVLLHRTTQDDVACDVLLPVDRGTATRELGRWLALYGRARRERVPFVARCSWTYAAARTEAERIAVAATGVDVAELEQLDDDGLVDRFGDVTEGRRSVASVIRRGLEAAHATWGRGEDRGFPVREQPEMVIVWRDLQRWEDLVEHTDLLRLSRDMLRPLAEALHAGDQQAAAVLP